MKDYKGHYKKVVREHFPEEMTITFGNQKLGYRKKTWQFNGETIGLRYGDNPGQEAALYELAGGNLKLGDCVYVNAKDSLIGNITELIETGKHIGRSNLTDVDSALNILKYFDEPTAVIMKHNNPSGVASRNTIREAYVEANFADRIAAFGGVVVLNREAGEDIAEEIVKNYVEVVAAPSFSEKALEVFSQKKNMRLMKIQKLKQLKQYRHKRVVEFRSLIDGSLLVQQSPDNEVSRDNVDVPEIEYKGKIYKVKQEPTDAELDDMLFAWRVLQGVISNSMVFAKNKTTAAICAGEQDRVGATELAVIKAYKKQMDLLCFKRHGLPLWELKDGAKLKQIEAEVKANNAGLKGAVLASDGFLPFRDTVDVAAKENVAGIIQPGGSTRDYQSIEAVNEYGMSMVFTAKRVFKH